jgi:hypothetical protein
MGDGSIICIFSAKGYDIIVFFDSNTVSRIVYKKASGFDTAGVEIFLSANGTGAVWTGPEKDDSDGSYRWLGIQDGAVAYGASLTTNGHALVIWTREDDD